MNRSNGGLFTLAGLVVFLLIPYFSDRDDHSDFLVVLVHLLSRISGLLDIVVLADVPFFKLIE